MSEGRRKLQEIAQKIHETSEPHVSKVKDFIGLYGYIRRGSRISAEIRRDLEALNLVTEPDIDVAWYYGDLKIRLADEENGEETTKEDASDDSTFRLRDLDAAQRTPVRAKRDWRLRKATTRMLLNDYSQLPVTQNYRQIDGVISWQSIGRCLTAASKMDYVSDCCEPAQKLTIDTPILDAIGLIYRHGYVLVESSDSSITGIVTISDIGDQFTQLSAPFIMIGEIEGYLRTLVRGVLTDQQLGQAVADALPDKAVPQVHELGLGDYCRLLQHKDIWRAAGLKDMSRLEFGKQLDAVRDTRNSVMHFRRDQREGLEPEAERRLRDMTRALRSLFAMGVLGGRTED